MTAIKVQVQLEAEWVELGTIRSELKRGSESGSFSYSDSYLANPIAYPIEPALPLQRGSFAAGSALHGAFRDCAPDRWGRSLINRWFRYEGKRASISELDYLLGVSDQFRVGNFRFETPLVPWQPREIPPMTFLPRLLRLSERVSGDDEYASTKELLEVGSASLGGARPKALVKDGDDLWLAKFPHPQDQWDVMAWEQWSLKLAEYFGITTPESRTVVLDGKTVLLVKRFDRVGQRRTGYISAMTLLGKSEGDSADYLEIAEHLEQQSESAASQLKQLWKRIALSVFVRNTDDHLRNHGFLRGRSGWLLSPVFDINPNPHGSNPIRATAIAGAVGVDAELRALLEYSRVFGLHEDQAISELQSLRECLTDGMKLENRPAVSRSETQLMFEALEPGLALLRDF